MPTDEPPAFLWNSAWNSSSSSSVVSHRDFLSEHKSGETMMAEYK